MVLFQVLDVETGSLLARLWDARSRPLYHLPNVGFNATDDLVVTDGALWDPRRGVGLKNTFCFAAKRPLQRGHIKTRRIIETPAKPSILVTSCLHIF